MPEFEIKEVDLGGRIGKLRLKDGKAIETPAFFPVVDPLKQEVSLRDLSEIGFDQIITNAYLSYKRTRGSLNKDIHEVLGWDKVIMMDSGGYQILEYGDVDVTQDDILIFQKNVGTEIGVILDVPTGFGSREDAESTATETLKRAKEALRLINPVEDKILWVLPIQGGRYLDVLERSAKESDRLPYKMFALGSPTVFLERYRYDIITDMIYTVKISSNPTKPLHLFGAGHPLVIPFAVALGVDTFDSASYIFYARDGRYMTETGVYRLEELEYLPCSCPVCRKYSVEELKEMSLKERTRLLALHNLYVIRKSIDETKQAIKEGRLWELLERYSRLHPNAYRTFLKFRKYYRLLKRGVSLNRSMVKGLRVYGKESLWNPKLLKFKSIILTKYITESVEHFKTKDIVFKPLPENPEMCENQLRDPSKYIVYYAPFLGIVPAELCGVYPTIHINGSGTTNIEVLKELVNTILVTINKYLLYGASSIEIFVKKDSILESFLIKLRKLPNVSLKQI